MDTVTTIDRFANSTLIAPSVLIEAGTDGRSVNTVSASPIRQSGGVTECGQEVVSTRVIGLFGRCCPSQIARLIVSVYINAVKRMAWRWATTNSTKELRKIVKSKLDTTPAVGVKSGVVRIPAPAFSGVVREKFGGVFATTRLAVRNGSELIECGQHAPARKTFVAAKTLTVNDAFSPTVASAQPRSTTVFGFTVSSKDGPMVKAFAREIYDRFVAMFHNAILTHTEGRFITLF